MSNLDKELKSMQEIRTSLKNQNKLTDEIDKKITTIEVQLRLLNSEED